MHNATQNVRGILLAGGKGSRLAPLTNAVSKHLLPIFDKPMIYYPLVAFMQADIREVLIISSPEHLPAYQQLLGTGQQWGIDLHYLPQPTPGGLPQAFQIGADFISGESVTLLLGDNIFLGGMFTEQLARFARAPSGATLFATRHRQPSDYGVVELGSNGEIVSLEEKPSVAKSDYVVTGAYCFDHRVTEYANTLNPSARGELEMIDLLKCYHAQSNLRVTLLEESTSWFDAGTPLMLLEASMAVADAQRQQGPIGCPEYTAKLNK